VQTVLPREVLLDGAARPRIARIHSGSWIDANYRIWIGHPEDNRAWTLLGEARRAVDQAAASAPPEALEKARAALYAAEGSDWFWWYGDDFTTENAPEFDSLFRRNVGQVFRHLGLAPPERLALPIIAPHKDRSQARAVVLHPRRLIHPVIDGYSHGYYEWSGAGIYRPGQALGGSMHQGGGAFLQAFYGFSLHDLFVRLDPARGTELSGELRILLTRERPAGALPWSLDGTLTSREEKTLRMPLLPGEECPVVDDRGTRCGTGRCGAIVELSVSLGALSIAPKDRIGMLLRQMRDEVEVDRLPRYGELELTVPDNSFEQAHWHV